MIPAGFLIYRFEEPDRLYLLYGNPEAEALTGLEMKDWIGKEFNEIWPNAREEGISDSYLRVMATGEPFAADEVKYEDERVKGAFRIRAFSLSGSRLAVSFEDVTARKQAERALKESEERHRTVIATSPEGFWLLDREGRFLDVNDAACRLLGYSRDEFLTLSVMDLEAEETPEETRARIEKIMAAGEDRFETRHRTRDGHMLDVEVRTRYTELEGGLFYAFIRDITERKRKDAELEASEARIRAVLEAVPDMIFHCAADGTYLDFWEGRGVDPLVPPEEFLGRTVAEIMSPDLTERTLEVFRKALETGEPQVMEFELPGPAGPRFFESHLSPFESGEVLSVTRDVTERVQAQKALEATNQQLRELTNRLQTVREEERRAVARELHDELGQTLAGLLIDLDWLGRRVPEEDPDGEEGMADRLVGLIQLAERANDMVHDLSARLRPPLLDELGLEAALEWHVKSHFKRSDLDYELILPRESLKLGPEMAITAFRIVQESITNVVRHAGATAAGVRMAQEGGDLILEVWDDGVGVDEDALVGGKGLGLMGLRERTAGLGGSVEVRRQEEGGTLVRAALPLRRTEQEDEEHT